MQKTLRWLEGDASELGAVAMRLDLTSWCLAGRAENVPPMGGNSTDKSIKKQSVPHILMVYPYGSQNSLVEGREVENRERRFVRG